MTDVDNAKVAVHIIVYGQVQGVGFRHFVQMQALPLDVVGWVRNCDDGTVELRAEGPRKVLERLVRQIEKGPRYGLVSHLKIEWEPPKNVLNGFCIRW